MNSSEIYNHYNKLYTINVNPIEIPFMNNRKTKK